ncbi:hypothetical protein Aduo_007666 [Ancylostoma duodenale]
MSTNVWYKNYPSNMCADQRRITAVMHKDGYVDVPAFVRRPVICVIGQKWPLRVIALNRYVVNAQPCSTRVAYRRRLSYNTKSNKAKIVKTPGSRLVFQYLKKRGSVPKCKDTEVKLHGITPARPRELTRLKKNQRTVSRTFGDCLSPNAVKECIIRSFLLEEQKIVSKVLKSRRGADN